MQGDALLIGIGTFGIGTAGFAAVAASLRSESKLWTPVHSIRVRAIVSTSFNVAFESVVPLIAALMLGDIHSALVVASLVTGTYALCVITIRGRQFVQTRAIRLRSGQMMVVSGVTSTTLFLLNAFFFASVGVYALALCFQLLTAAVSFYSLIADTT
ncbi:MAG TPA: hypothetical protein VND96_02615 [Candidatus Micrarchaeaceae archaeon]|nr:hypothetical protein [Candidatus Micrarchaeaceae archaeon]